MQKIIRLTVVVLMLSGNLWAQSNSTSAVPEVVVTTTRTARPLHETPHYIHSVSSEALRIERAVRTVPEALKAQTGIMVQKTAHGQGSPYIRGFTAYHNLMMIDGIRLNNSVFRSGPNQYWNTVDALSIDRIEVVKGPSSSLYGSDAIGGTVNAFTQRRMDYPAGVNWDGRTYYRYSSAERSHIGRMEISGNVDDQLGVAMGYSYKDFGNLEGGQKVGTHEKTAYDEQDWNIRLDYFPSDDSHVILAHQGVGIDDAWRTHKTIYGISWEGTTVGTELRRSLDQDRRLTYVQYHQQNLDSFCDQFRAGVSYQLQGEKRDRIQTRDRHDIQGFDVATLGSFLQFRSPSSAGLFVYGIESYHDNVNSFKKTYNPDGSLQKTAIQGPVGDDATYDIVGIYAQDIVSLADPLSLVIGCRYDYAAAVANSVEDPDTGGKIRASGNWDSVAGSGRVLYYLDQQKSCALFAGVAQGFRAPNLSDLTRLDSARTDEIETPAPNLKPERFVAYEIGMKVKTAQLSGQFAYFYTDIDDMIVRTPTGMMIDDEYEVTKKNAGEGYVHGVEMEAAWWPRENWTVSAAFTWMDGAVDTYPTSDPAPSREPIDRLMPPSGRLGLRWNSKGKYWVEVQCRVAAKAEKLSTRDQSDTQRIPPGGTPGYVVCDLRAGWHVRDRLKLSAALENIGDKDYRIHGSGMNEAGRNFVIAADYAF